MTPQGRKFAENCALVQSKAKELIRERRTALQDSVSAQNIILSTFKALGIIVW